MTYSESQRRFHMVANRQALQLLVKYNRLSYRALAKKAGVSHGLIGDLITGRRNTCTPESATKLEDALGADPNTIFQVRALPVATTPAA